jgi:hypothetical protein
MKRLYHVQLFTGSLKTVIRITEILDGDDEQLRLPPPSFSNQTIGAPAEDVARLKSADFHNSRWNAAAVLS